MRKARGKEKQPRKRGKKCSREGKEEGGAWNEGRKGVREEGRKEADEERRREGVGERRLGRRE